MQRTMIMMICGGEGGEREGSGMFLGPSTDDADDNEMMKRK